MFSLRSISLFALACTVFTSAAPAINVARASTNPLTGAVAALTTGNGGLDASQLAGRGLPDHKSFPDCFGDAHDRLGPIIASLEADIKVVGAVDVVAVVGHLNLVVDVLADVLAEVSVVVKADGYLVSKGVTLTVDAVAKIIFDVLFAIFVILQAVVKVVVDARVLAVVAQIGIKLVAILKAIVIIDVGLQASLAILVKAVVDAIKVLQFTDILAVLKIVV